MKLTLASLALAALSVASPVPDTTATGPSSYKITNIVSGGSGCPQGSIDINYNDNTVFPICKSISNKTSMDSSLINSLDFGSAFTATVGPNVAPDSARKNCQLAISLQYSGGWQFAVYAADYAGYGELDAGVKGTVKSTYYFGGNQDQVKQFLANTR